MESEAYLADVRGMRLPPVTEQGRRNENPPGIGFWPLVAEDLGTHDGDLLSPGFWALFVCRFGNWRMGQPKIVRAPATLLHRVLFRLTEMLWGISLWYTTRVGRRVHIWHHSGIVLSARAIGDDVQIRQNTTMGIRNVRRLHDLPIIAAGADIGAGACIVGAVRVGRNARVAANALVFVDVPDGALAIGNPAVIRGASSSVSGAEEPGTAA